MKVIERLGGSIVASRKKVRGLCHNQPGTFLAAAIFAGISVPLGLSLKAIAEVVRMHVKDYTLAEAELAASKLDISIAQQKVQRDGIQPFGNLPEHCLVPENPPPTDKQDSPTGEAGLLFVSAKQQRSSSYISEGRAVESSDPEQRGLSPSSAGQVVVTPKVSGIQCYLSEALATEPLADILQTLGVGTGRHWFLLNELGQPVFTPDILSDKQWQGWPHPSDLQWQNLVQAIGSDRKGISRIRVGEQTLFVAYTRLQEADWLLGLAILEGDFNRHHSLLNALAGLIGLGGAAAATLVGLSIANYRSAEKARLQLKNKEERMERERQLWNLNRQQHQEQIYALQDQTVQTISNTMTGPLTNLKQAITLLSTYGSTLHPTQLKAYIEVMEQAICRLVNTFDRIISLRNLESIPSVPRMAPVNLSQLCEDLVERCGKGYYHQIELNFRGTCGTVYLDSYLVQLVLEPVLHNAVKYSGNHPELPPIEFYVDCRHRDRIEFMVKDRGLGIPPKDLKEVFLPFVRGQNVRHFPGIGLGLAIAKQAIDAMRGELIISSGACEGTIVTAIVPVSVSQSTKTLPT